MRKLLVFLSFAIVGVLGAVTLPADVLEAGGGGRGGGAGCINVPLEGTGESVSIKDSCFTTFVLYVETGSTVEWTNEDSVSHNVMFLDGEVAGDKPTLSYGESVSRSFAEPGLFAYYCSIHKAMVGVVAVGDQASAMAPGESEAVASSAGSAFSTERIAGLVLAVGIVSAGGDYLLNRRRPR